MKKMILYGIFSLLLAVAAGAAVQPPENLNIIYVNDNTFEIVWDATSDTFPVSYTISRAISVSQTPASFASTTLCSYTDSTADTFNTYYYTASAMSASGENSVTTEVRKSKPMPSDVGTPVAEPQNSKILIRWNLSADPSITGYAVYRSTWTGGNYTRMAEVPGTQPQYLDTSTVNGLLYKYRLSSIDTSEGAIMPGITATPFAAPFAPVNVTAAVTVDTGVNTVTVRISWPAGQVRGSYDVQNYDIYYSYSAVTPDAYVTTAYFDVVLAKGNRHYFRIIARDINGNLSPQSYYTFFLTDNSMLAPANLGTTGMTSGRVSFTWTSANDPDQIDGYKIYRDSAEIGTTTMNSFTDTSVICGSAYNYTVAAWLSPTAVSAQSGALPVTVTPAAPVILSLSQTGTGELTLSWANPAFEDAGMYDIYRSITPSVYTEPVISNSINAYSLTDTPLTLGQKYYYKILSIKDGQYSAGSAEVSATAIAAPVTTTVSEITGLAGDPFNTYVNLTWTVDPAFDLQSYTVYYRAGTATAYLSITTSATSRIISGLTNGITYTFNVTGTNALGTGVTQAANDLEIAPAVTGLDKPVLLAVDSPGNSSLAVSWSAVNGAGQYRVYRSLAPGGVPDSIVATTTALSYVDFKVYTEDAYYSYKIETINQQGTPAGIYSDIKGNSQYTRVAPPGNVELNNTAQGIMLSWSKPSEAYTYDTPPIVYKIFRSSYSGGFTVLPGMPITGTYYEDLDANTLLATLYYRVRAYDSLSNEDSGSTTFTINVNPPLEPPGVLVARPGDHKATLTWKKVTPDYYNIYRRGEFESYGAPIGHNIVFDSREFIDDPGRTNPALGLTNLSKYFYTIAAVNSGGEGPRADEVSAIPYAPPEITNRRVTCTAKDKKDVLVNWEKATASGEGYPVSGYNIYKSSDNGWTYSLVNYVTYSADTQNYCTDTATEWDKTYTYLIKVLDNQGNLDAAYDPAVIKLPLPQNRLRIFANLVDLSKGQSLTWQYVLTKPGKLKVKVYTLSGSFVKQLADAEYTGTATELDPFQSPEMIWDGTNARGAKVASGVYILMLELDGQKSMHKVAVIK